MSDSTRGALIFLGIIAVACLAVGAFGGNFVTSQFVTGGEIRMVQPSGILPERDGYYANNVNVPNSQANLNNGQAREAVGQANVNNAMATAIINQAYIDNGNAKNAGFLAGAPIGCLGGAIIVGLFVLAIWGVASLMKNGSSP